MASTIRILLIDDHAVVRLGFNALLSQAPGCEVVGEAAKGESGYVMVRELRPDVVVLDLSMPGLSGISVAHRIKSTSPRTRILVVSMHEELAYVRQALKAGADGYVSKRAIAEELVTAVRAVASGTHYIDHQIAHRIIESELCGTHDPFAVLSVREFEIVKMTVRGFATDEIATRLALSQKSVVDQLAAARRKLAVDNVAEMVLLATRHGVGVRTVTSAATDARAGAG